MARAKLQRPLDVGGLQAAGARTGQVVVVRGHLTAASFTQVQSRRDLPGIERCSGGGDGLDFMSKICIFPLYYLHSLLFKEK